MKRFSLSSVVTLLIIVAKPPKPASSSKEGSELTGGMGQDETSSLITY